MPEHLKTNIEKATLVPVPIVEPKILLFHWFIWIYYKWLIRIDPWTQSRYSRFVPLSFDASLSTPSLSILLDSLHLLYLPMTFFAEVLNRLDCLAALQSNDCYRTLWLCGKNLQDQTFLIEQLPNYTNYSFCASPVMSDHWIYPISIAQGMTYRLLATHFYLWAKRLSAVDLTSVRRTDDKLAEV
jgi:hypothetical protein